MIINDVVVVWRNRNFVQIFAWVESISKGSIYVLWTLFGCARDLRRSLNSSSLCCCEIKFKFLQNYFKIVYNFLEKMPFRKRSAHLDQGLIIATKRSTTIELKKLWSSSDVFSALKNLCDFFFLLQPQNQLLRSQFTKWFFVRIVKSFFFSPLDCHATMPTNNRASARSRNVLSLKRRRSPWMNEKFFSSFYHVIE